jgi:hypothetical protein
LDWEGIVRLALKQDVAPLVHAMLQRLNITREVAPAVRQKLANAYYGNAIRNELLFEELGRVLAAIRKAGKAVIILKGAALTDTVYRNRALRPMSDVDLLVRRPDVPAVEDLLLAMNYVLNERQRNSREWCWESDYHFAFRRQLNPSLTACVEIHWHLESAARPQRLDIGGVWERAVSAENGHASALRLSEEDLLLYLCLHTCKHRLNGGLRAFCDIAETVRLYRNTLDWVVFCRRALQWGIGTFVYAALHIARELLDAPVPENVFADLHHPVDEELLRIAVGAVMEDRVHAALFPDFFQLERGRGAKARTAVLRKLFSSAVMADRYGVSPNSSWLYCYYPVRFTELMLRYSPELLRFVRQGRGVLAQAEARSRLEEWLGPLTTPDGGVPEDSRS